jgi:hypothetical protein
MASGSDAIAATPAILENDRSSGTARARWLQPAPAGPAGSTSHHSWLYGGGLAFALVPSWPRP